MRTIGNGYKYTETKRTTVIEEYNRLIENGETVHFQNLASKHEIATNTLRAWTGKSCNSLKERVNVRLKNNVITYKGKTYTVSSTTPTRAPKTALRAEGTKLFKELNITSATKLKEIKNSPEYYKTVARLIRESVFGLEVITDYKAENLKGNIWDSELATSDKLQTRVNTTKLLIKYVDNGFISSYSGLLKAIKVVG